MAILTTTTTTTAPSLTHSDGSGVAWISGAPIDKGTIADLLDDIIKDTLVTGEEGIITLHAEARLNRPSLASPNKGLVIARLKRRLLNDLFDKLVDANVISIASEPTKTGGLKFEATR